MRSSRKVCSEPGKPLWCRSGPDLMISRCSLTGYIKHGYTLQGLSNFKAAAVFTSVEFFLDSGKQDEIALSLSEGDQFDRRSECLLGEATDPRSSTRFPGFRNSHLFHR
jgi:hypothetical protein